MQYVILAHTETILARQHLVIVCTAETYSDTAMGQDNMLRLRWKSMYTKSTAGILTM
jgi:hypothetical protein